MDMDKYFSNPEAEERIRQAVVFIEKGKPEKTEKLLRKITQNFPDFVPALIAYGELLLMLGKPARALSPLRKAARLHTTGWIPHFLLGCAYSRCGRFSFALQELEMADGLKPEDSKIIQQIGWVKVATDNIDEGRKMLKKAIEINRTNVVAYSDMAASYLKVGEYKQALE